MSVGGSGGSTGATGAGGGQSQGIAIPNKRLFSRIRTDSEQSSNSGMPPDEETPKDTRSMSLAPVSEQIIEEDDEKQRMFIDHRNNSVVSRMGDQSNQGDDLIDDDMLMYEMIESGVPPPPDGGWGWVIVFASFMCNLIVDGIAYTFGVFLPKFAMEFVPQDKNEDGKVENGSIPWVGSLLCGMYLCVGPIVSALTNKFGCRRVCIAGSFIAALGFALSSFSQSLPILMLTYGVIGGIGFGFIYLPAVVCVGYYFETKRAVATGIAVCGSGVGTFVFAPFATWLLQQTDWRNANLVLSALIFSCAVFGALMRPLEIERRPVEEGYDDGQDDPEKRGPTQNRSLLQRMADDKRNYMEKSSIAGSAYFMVQLPDGTMERRLKLPLNVDPGVHSSFNLDQLVPGSPLHNAPAGVGNSLTVPTAVPAPPQLQPALPSVGGGLPTITEVKISSNNASAPNSSEESSRSGSGEITKNTETDSVPEDKKPKSNSVTINKNDTNANTDIDEMNFLSDTISTSPPIPIPEAIQEEKENEDSPRTSFDSSEGIQLSASGMAAKRRMRERRSSEGTSLSPPSSAGMRGSPMKIITSAGGPRKSSNIPMPNTVAPTSFVRIPRNESAPQFMYGRSLPKNGSVPLFDRMMARKHSFRAVPMGSSVVRNTSRPNLQDRRASKASIASKNNNYGTQLDEDYNSLWSRSELNEGLIFSTSRKSSETRHIVRPLSRKDIFYSGSIAHLPEYQSTKDIGSYRQSILNLPRATGGISFTAGGDEGDGEGGELLRAVSPIKVVKPTICPCLPCGWITTGAFETALAQLMDFSLLKNPVFLFVAISNVFGMLGFYVPFVFLTGAAQANDIPEDIAAYLLSIIGITNTIGRILSGFLSDLPQVNSLFMNNICILLSGLCVAAVPFCTTFPAYVAVATFFGLFVSGYVSLTSIILVELLGLDNLTNAFGLLILFRGAASIVGPPVAGAVFDFFASYDVSFFLAGGFLVVSAFISFLIPCVTRFAPPKPVLEPPAIYGGYYLEDIPEAVESLNTESPNSPTSGGPDIEKCDDIESSV